MAEILVVFPPQNGNTDPPPTVSHEMERVPKGHTISWNFVSCNDQVNAVKIEFEDPRATFFNGVNTAWAKPVGPDRKTLIWGKVEFPEGSVNGPFYGKYKVIGLTSVGGAEVVSLDPVIVTGDPG